jgi:hypothetical protein
MKMTTLAWRSQQPSSNGGNKSDYLQCWTFSSNITVAL